MARRKLEDRNTRKLSKQSNGSYAVTLPIEIVRELKWRDKQKLVVRKSGDKIIIEDWKK
jgi:antitoxin component of MazEF toxin-antitoxin module